MEDQICAGLKNEFVRIERRLWVCEGLLALFIIGLLAATWAGLHGTTAKADDSAKVLRLQGLIIEDTQGRPRILLGAPVTRVPGRRRQDETVGVIVLGENGADRVAIGAPTPAPQIRGHVARRISPSAGLVIDDSEGNERGGFGVLDGDGRVVLGLDYPMGTGEAIGLAVIPGEAVGLHINDQKSYRRASFFVSGDSAAKLLGMNPHGMGKVEVGLVRLAPFARRGAIVKAEEKAVLDIIQAMKP